MSFAEELGDPIRLAVAQTEHDRDVRRTKWLAVECGAFVAATVVIAAFTDWTPHGDGKRGASASVSVGRGGGSLELRYRF